MARKADIIVSATGVSGLITPEIVKENCVLIDVGFTRKITDTGRVRIMGDIDPRTGFFTSLRLSSIVDVKPYEDVVILPR